MNKFNKIIKNEEGSMTLLWIGVLGGMMVLFLFVLNLSKVLAVKEQANTTSQQASFAATSVIYDNLSPSISSYDNYILSLNLDPLPKLLSEKIAEMESSIRSNPRYRDYSSNEISLEAMDRALTSELSGGFEPELLKNLLENALQSAVPTMISVARDTIAENKGNIDEAKIRLKDNRIYIRASNDFNATAYDKYIKGFRKKLFQESAGPEIGFLSSLSLGISDNWIPLGDEEITWEEND